MSAAHDALARLRAARHDGTLHTRCDDLGVRLLVAHGSTVHAGLRPPRDLDVAVLLDDGTSIVDVVNALIDVARYDHVDVMDLRRASPLAKANALERGEALFEASPGLFVRSQVAATKERIETRWLRSLDLDLLAS